MDSLLQKIREYIVFLKETGDFTWEEIDKLSGESASTLRKFCSGKTETMHFDALLNVVSALGGNINNAVSYTKQKEAEVNSVIVLKETYEQKIEALTLSYEARINDIKAACELRIADILECCELRVADCKQNYEERLHEYKNVLSKLHPELIAKCLNEKVKLG